ncbi:MAG: (4Fe-4S)-binding protein [Bifidobacteriaceae bacterium]|nr:(4Fe-4S)-binding protein [Bifidobacteriaceae bacterium]
MLPDAAPAAELAAVIDRCPSTALRYQLAAAAPPAG